LRTKVWALTLIRGIFSVLSPNAFPTFGNLLNVLNQASLTMIIAGGLTVAVVVGELDLSIGFAASYRGFGHRLYRQPGSTGSAGHPLGSRVPEV
jgi:ribose/xylose/arabinose/galactoside ABC-type transport system permease subunit